jgi:hypothetical protein
MTYQMNVGLHINDDANTDQDIATRATYVRSWIHRRYPNALIRQADSKTEPTVIVEMPTEAGLIPVVELANKIALVLEQDCVAVAETDGSTEITHGWLIGPRSHVWGNFNPEHFLKF